MRKLRPDLSDLALLVAVAEHGSIGAAASSQGLTQPSVSRRISLLERDLGVRLLARSPRGSHLTPEGRVIVDWSEKLLRAADDFAGAVQALRDLEPRSLTVGVSMTIAEHLAPLWLARAQTPGASTRAISMVIANSNDVAEMVSSARLDFGLVESPLRQSGMGRVVLRYDDLVVAVAPSHKWAQTPSITAAELARERLLIRETGSGTRDTIEQAFEKQGLSLRPGMELASNSALKAAAIAGLGPVVVSEMAVRHELASRRLVVVTVDDLPLRRPISAIWRESDGIPQAARGLLNAALAWCSAHGR